MQLSPGSPCAPQIFAKGVIDDFKVWWCCNFSRVLKGDIVKVDKALRLRIEWGAAVLDRGRVCATVTDFLSK